MAISKMTGGADVHWNIIDSRAKTIYLLADTLRSERGRLWVVRQMCEHIANHAAGIEKLNREHIGGYSRDGRRQYHAAC